MANLLDQLKLGPQQLEQKKNDKHEKSLTTEKKSITAAQKEFFRTKARELSNMPAFGSVQHPPTASSAHAFTPIAPLNSQLPKPVFDFQAWNFPQTTSPFRNYPNIEGNNTMSDTAIANPFLASLKNDTRPHFQSSVSLTPNSIAPFGSATTNKPGPAIWANSITHAPLSSQSGPPQDYPASIPDKPSLQETREKQKRKEADMESGEDEEDWERRDAQKQARKKAKILPARQISSPFFSFTSTAPVSRPASLQSSAVPFSFDVQQRVHAFPFPNTHASASFTPFQPMPSISRSPNSGSLSPDELSREPYDRAIRNFSSFPVRQEPRNEIKVEEIIHELPKKIKVEETSGIPES